MKKGNKVLKKALAIFIAASLMVGIAGCGNSKSEEKSIKVGSKDLTENLIVAEVYALALEDAGFWVERVMDIAGSVVHTSIMNGEIDLYPEYTGTGLISILKMDPMTDAQQVYDTVKEEYEKQYKLIWLDYSQANDGQGLVIRTDIAEKYGIKTISDLQKNASELRFASQGEFDQREDGMLGLEKLYGPFDWKSSKVYDGGLKYSVLENDEADAAPAYTTEGQLVKDEFTLLEDDKKLWPPYNLAPVVRETVLNTYPEIADILNKISATLDTKTVTKLNAEADVEKREYEEVAKEYYDSIK
ncbi:glycine betaine ABC transporter substrate-binding protein [Robinsoniella peoriensis]|uniref:glycine betaine ABC transporter substrate-binding protein n=1 Tax=Robinsoniella peoriensis TaxID=180332 RepID=UPI003645DCBE